MSSRPVFKIGRRHFLAGVGGMALAIPYLPSLEREARAGGGTARTASRYFFVMTDHGGCYNNNFYPQNAKFGAPQKLSYGLNGHTVQAAPIDGSYGNLAGGRAGVSNVIQANSGTFTKTLAKKLNLLQGLDVPWYLAHNQGLNGAYQVNNGSGSAGQDGYNVALLGARPTIDQIMAGSSGFYASTPKAPSIPIAGAYGQASQAHSWAFSGAQKASSTVVAMNNTQSSLPLFQQIFTSGTTTKTRASAVDRVRGTFSSLMTSNSRISAADKFRLSQHIDALNTLEGSLNAHISCPTTPAAPADNQQNGFYNNDPNYTLWGQLFMEVIAAAFICNASRVGSFAFGDTSLFSPSFVASGIGNWHQNVAHEWGVASVQPYLVESYQAFFEQVFLYLAAKLDGAIDPDGNTVLDNSLLVWTQECCMETHEQMGIQTATFGGASGNMKTDLYCDYRNQNYAPAARQPGVGQNFTVDPAIMNYTTWPGLLWEQWLATQLHVMQIPAADWQLWNDAKGAREQGYGVPYLQVSEYGTHFAEHYLPAATAATWKGGSVTMDMSPYYSNAGTPLPFLTA
jgi:hypothetical protein